jgi:hypothetical protein
VQRILEIRQRIISRRGQQQRTTTGDLSCKGYGRYGKGTSAEEDTGGTTEDHRLRGILEV